MGVKKVLITGKNSYIGKGRARLNEGETGIMEKAAVSDAGFENYGHKKKFHIDKGAAKKVLITGAGSYIGESFRSYAAKHYPNLTVDTVDMKGGAWREHTFFGHDAVLHVAGIAHRNMWKVSDEEKMHYYAVNEDLAVEAAEAAKRGGVRQFILMSSMSVYGDSAPYGKRKWIDEKTVPSPANFYGDSKWRADMRTRRLSGEGFHVAALRVPMVYGKGCKGNYAALSRLAKHLPLFPDVENRRSMIHIDNLCEFLCLLILSGEGGVYFPQNGEYTKTVEMAREIARARGKRICVSKLLNPVVAIGSRIPGKVGGLMDKAFGNCAYSQRLSEYEGLAYRVVGFKESIRQTEGAGGNI